MATITIQQLRAQTPAGQQERVLFFNWMIGQLAPAEAIFDAAVEQYRNAPTPQKLHALYNFAMHGSPPPNPGQQAVNVPPGTLQAARLWVTNHPLGAPGWIPAAPPAIFDIAQNDLYQQSLMMILAIYDNSYTANPAGMARTIQHGPALQPTNQAWRIALHNGGFNTNDLGMVGPYV